MSFLPSPQSPQYRVTLFFGPEPAADHPSCTSCVFNVKKRSWKGGVQVAVEMEDEQLARARQVIGFDPWLQAALAAVPEAVQSDYERRAQDLFTQALCSLKLDVAIEAGLPQENRTIPASAFADEVNRAVPSQADRIKAQILAELDIPNKAE
ncbi:MAG: hypothetical protein FJ249_09800 [Nitrospira sp.]|nr:hypothetical protein [Nitrospira sp.]